MSETHSPIVIIPARIGSSRFPGKPLAKIAGMSLIERVWRIAASAFSTDRVFIATDSEEILKHTTNFTSQTVMTSASCRNGTERVAEALDKLQLSAQTVINLQGDAPLVPPQVLKQLAAVLESDPNIQIATPAVKLTNSERELLITQKNQGITTGTTVVFDKNFDALYFSKTVIPFQRSKDLTSASVYQHIGLYGFSRKGLSKFIACPESPLEQAEQLEQLRALENGMRIKVVPVDLDSRTLWSVDNPEDISIVERIILEQGELF